MPRDMGRWLPGFSLAPEYFKLKLTVQKFIDCTYDAVPGNTGLRRSSIQTAEIRVENGRLVALRDEEFDFYLPDEAQ